MRALPRRLHSYLCLLSSKPKFENFSKVSDTWIALEMLLTLIHQSMTTLLLSASSDSLACPTLEILTPKRRGKWTSHVVVSLMSVGCPTSSSRVANGTNEQSLGAWWEDRKTSHLIK
jgi:hypothetical protein